MRMPDVTLTAIRMPLGELGRVAVDTLIDEVEGSPPRDVTVDTPPHLVVREIHLPTAGGRMKITAGHGAAGFSSCHVLPPSRVW